MTKLVLIVVAALFQLAFGASIVDVTCPDSCSCQVKDESLETSCTSYEFIKKLIPKQISTIVSLKINNASLVNVDSKLKYLKNLHTLDLADNDIYMLPYQFPYLPKLRQLNLSGNHLSSVAFGQLPKNLKVIDLSNNSIRNIPEDLSNLNQLKTIYLHDNPIGCDCNNLLIYEKLNKTNVQIPDDLICHYPKEFYGKPLNSVDCLQIRDNLLNLMLGDESGSGLDSGEIIDENNSPLSDDKEFINAEGIIENRENEMNEEGSGEEGSGFDVFVPNPIPQACHFNCSTPPPIGLHDEKDASPSPHFKEQVEMIFNDLVHPDQTEIESTTAPTSIEEASETPIEAYKIDPSQEKSFPTNDTFVREQQKASTNQSVYIIVGLLIAFVIFLIIYVINKKRNKSKLNKRKRNKSNENGVGEELKPLGVSAETGKPLEQINSKIPKAESAPLLNGQNGKINEDNVKSDGNEENNEEDGDVELRKNDKQELITTPQPSRVTIKAGEIPDSVPKTPLLVQRHLNSDGEIVTTAVN